MGSIRLRQTTASARQARRFAKALLHREAGTDRSDSFGAAKPAWRETPREKYIAANPLYGNSKSAQAEACATETRVADAHLFVTKGDNGVDPDKKHRGGPAFSKRNVLRIRSYSWRRATMGSTRMARRAGM